MNDEVASSRATSSTKTWMSLPCIETCRNFSVPSSHAWGVEATSVEGDPARASLISMATPVTRTYRYPPAERLRHSPPWLAELPLVNQQPKDTSGESKSMVAARAPGLGSGGAHAYARGGYLEGVPVLRPRESVAEVGGSGVEPHCLECLRASRRGGRP